MATVFLPALEEVDLKPCEEGLIDTPPEEFVEPVDGPLDEEVYYEEEDDDVTPSDLPEDVILPLPSNVVSIKCQISEIN